VGSASCLSFPAALIGVLRKPLAAYSSKIMGGKIMAFFIILPFMILQEAKNASVQPGLRSAPINAVPG
jgi:hypothetical protein